MKILNISMALAMSIFCATTLNAQNYADALRYSQKFYQGTARTAASGNAFGAVGADFGSININPAGLGLYRRAEFTAGFSFNQQTGKSAYLGNTATDDKYNLNVSNLGIVLSDVKYKLGKPVQQGWVSVNFALGFNRTNNFHNNIAVEGTNIKNSILNSWTQQAQGKPINSFSDFSYPYMSYQTYLMDYDSTNQEFIDVSDTSYNKNRKFFQGDYLNTRGAMNDISLSLAGNYSNKLYLGATLSVPTIGYHSIRQFTETNQSDSIGYYNNLDLTETINTSGVGITANIGVIYRPSDVVRLGAALHLPTFYSMYDSYNSELVGNTKDKGAIKYATPQGNYEYSMVTPMRANLSGAVFFGKSGFLSADYEFVDYTTARFNYEGSRPQNEIIRRTLKSTGNVRIGGEYRYENMSFRGGVEMHGSPYVSSVVPNDFNSATNIYSAGIGFRESDYYLDLTYQNIRSKYFHLPYTISNQAVEGANVTSVRNNIMLTIGSKF